MTGFCLGREEGVCGSRGGWARERGMHRGGMRACGARFVLLRLGEEFRLWSKGI